VTSPDEELFTSRDLSWLSKAAIHQWSALCSFLPVAPPRCQYTVNSRESGKFTETVGIGFLRVQNWFLVVSAPVGPPELVAVKFDWHVGCRLVVVWLSFREENGWVVCYPEDCVMSSHHFNLLHRRVSTNHITPSRTFYRREKLQLFVSLGNCALEPVAIRIFSVSPTSSCKLVPLSDCLNM